MYGFSLHRFSWNSPSLDNICCHVLYRILFSRADAQCRTHAFRFTGCQRHCASTYVCMYVCMSYPECHPNRPGSMEVTCGNKMPTRCNRGFYCRSYCLLNKFRAPLCPSSGAQEYYTVVAACGISCCGFQVAGLVCSWGLCVRFAGCCIVVNMWK